MDTKASSVAQSTTDGEVHVSTMFNDPDADVIIRSLADLVDFRVRKAVLSEASTFFKDMFSLPQADATDTPSTDGVMSAAALPIIPVSEDEKTLALFLR